MCATFDSRLVSTFLPSPPTNSALYGAVCHSTGQPSAYQYLPSLPFGAKDLRARDGLRTPPSSAMTTTYQVPPAAPYDHHGMPSYPTTFAPARMPSSMTDSVRPAQFSRHPSQHPPAQAQAQIYSQPTPVPRDPASGASHYSALSRYSTKPTTPAGETSIAGEDAATASRRSSQTLIHHSLQIPTRINPKGGNLADFAAEVRRFLFLFTSSQTNKVARSHAFSGSSPSTPSGPRRRFDHAPRQQPCLN